MTAEPIEVRIAIGAAVYTITVVDDPADAMFAFQLGRAVSEAVLRHAESLRPPCDHDPERCCIRCGVHVMPHRGCFLR